MRVSNACYPQSQVILRVVSGVVHGAVMLMLLGVMLVYLCIPRPVLVGDLPIHAPQTIMTGTAFTVTVGPVSVRDGTQVGLVMMGEHGPRVYYANFAHGIAQFRIPGEHTLQPGFFAFVAAAQGARGETGMILRSPLVPKHRINLGML